MSSPPYAPNPRPMPVPPSARRPAPKMKKKRLPWGWLEWFLVAQTFIPALLFVPGVSAARVVIRVAVFVLALGTWAVIVWSGRARAGEDSFAAGSCLKFVIGWLLISIFHWATNSPAAGLAQAMLYIAVLSPAFWAPRLLSDPRRLSRLMVILLVCNGLSALVGLGQVFRPGTFNPPVIPGVTDVPEDSISALALTYTDQFGRRIIRPCGLSDMVGSAAGAGATAAMLGLAWALRPIGWWRRLACAGLAFCGVAVIYYSQVRMTFAMLVISLGVLVAIFMAQKNFGYATLLGGLGAAMIVGAFSWVMATSGSVVVERFLGLASQNFGKTYAESGRGTFVNYAFNVMIWEGPLGYGLGQWGAVNGIFGDRVRGSIWVEVMINAWIVDGGIPLLVLYSLALALAMANTLRIALRCRDREIAFWAAVIFGSELSIVATCLSYVTFVTAIGLQFWFLAAVVHAADYRVRLAARRAGRRPPPGGSPPVAVAARLSAAGLAAARRATAGRALTWVGSASRSSPTTPRRGGRAWTSSPRWSWSASRAGTPARSRRPGSARPTDAASAGSRGDAWRGPRATPTAS
jgi:hypothetical protein